MPRASLVAIVLAAGASRRMGEPKAVLELDGRPLIGHVLDGLGTGWCETVVVVGGVHEATVRAALPSDGSVSVLRNDAPERGQLSSLQVAIRWLSAAASNAEGAVVALVDHPLVKGATVEQLVASAGAEQSPIIVPIHRGRRGHPIVLMRPVWREILATPDEAGARAVVRRDPARVREVEVSDPGVLVDIDTIAEFDVVRRPKVFS